MSTYVCIVFGPATDVLRMEAFEAAGDGHACGRAIALQRMTAESSAFELWRDGRKVSAFYGRESCPRPPNDPPTGPN